MLILVGSDNWLQPRDTSSHNKWQFYARAAVV